MREKRDEERKPHKTTHTPKLAHKTEREREQHGR
jgi:hypothetical protein